MNQIWIAILGSSVLSAIISWGMNFLYESNIKEKRERTYSALLLATALEKFAIECASRVSDINSYIDHQGQMGHPYTSMPPEVNFSKEINWKLLEHNFSERSFKINNAIILGNAMIDAVVEFGDQEEVLNSCRFEIGKCGFEVYCLLREVKQKYKLLKIDTKYGFWDYAGVLEQANKKWHELGKTQESLVNIDEI